MNFLAHLLLSCQDEELIVGNFLGDFIKNRDLPGLPPGIQQGIRLHRFIDTYTDNHPVVRQGTHRLQKRHGKYAGVVIDVLYDYILANHWAHYHSQSLGVFTQGIYQVLEQNLPLMPARLQQRVPLMIADDWLVQYGTTAGIAYTFSRLQQRVSKPEYLEDALVSLHEDQALLVEEFSHFFPAIAQEVSLFCDC